MSHYWMKSLILGRVVEVQHFFPSMIFPNNTSTSLQTRGPISFWLPQKMKQKNGLKLLNGKILEYTLVLKPDELVMVKWSDGYYYKAKIIRKTKIGYEVNYYEYDDTEDVELNRLQEEKKKKVTELDVARLV
eukprot:TRINITY_DN4565_c0_g1_i1.p1 TRINITY_DN4565_c0_g1~~TRINITY_DN4565_c0_g1_i1.p1  ORF type:complete len:132 (-),score=11.65 TRINITY_DN4565_c0_g1_i1:28-423(-)